MNYVFGISIALLCLTSPMHDLIYPPKKAKCPFKNGVLKKLTEHHGAILGPGQSTVDIWGTDSIIVSATDGRVTDVISVQGTPFIRIQTDTTIFFYADFDHPLVREGQQVRAGQPIAFSSDNQIEFYVANNLGKIFHHPEEYVDCVCELPKADK